MGKTELGGNRIADKTIDVNHLKETIEIPESYLKLDHSTKDIEASLEGIEEIHKHIGDMSQIDRETVDKILGEDKEVSLVNIVNDLYSMNDRMLEAKVEKEEYELSNATIMMELAQKENKLKEVEEEMAIVVMEVAMMKGGM